MDETRLLEVKRNVLAANDAEADAFRAQRQAEGTLFVDVMASPGAGKTTLLLATIAELERRGTDIGSMGVIEADLESDVDALKIKEACVASVELNTRGVCHVEMGMVQKAFAAFGDERFDWLFLENIGNLVCPADFDTGAHARIMLLSVPEGYDKVVQVPSHVRYRGRPCCDEKRLLANEPRFRHGRPRDAGPRAQPRTRSVRDLGPHGRRFGRVR